ncbi:unnamed protein product [Effrenium voratum]|nr:unnamed protein product [Effrenium voratum]
MDVVMGDAEVERMQREAKAWPLEQLELLRKVLQNVVENPKEPKFRKLKTGNARIAALLALPAARSGLEALGWQATEEALELPERAELAPFAAVLEATKPQPLGELVPLTVLRGALKSKLELPCNLPFSGLAAALEQSDALGRIPRARQRLLVGVPPKPLSELWPNYQAMTIEELNLKAFKLEDTWEEMVADLRALRASFGALLGVLSCKRTLQDNYGFLLDSAKALLQAKAKQMDATELQNARKCFAVLWPPGAAETRQARLEHCAACTPLSAPQKAEDGSVIQFPLRVERAELFDSAISQIASASAEELRRPLQVTFANEAAEDAGGPRREFFNDFGRACAEQTEVWQLTAAGSLLPAECASSLRGCGRVCGLALCQAENAAQEQRVRENETGHELQRHG